MTEIFIYHHMGLGDYLILNGFVRNVAESYDRIWLFAKPGNESKNIRRLYKDNKKIIIISLNDKEVHDYMRIFAFNNYMVVGHTPDFFKRVDDPTNGKTFDELFFEDHNIPFEYKWDKFHYERDLEKEKEVFYDILGLDDKSEFNFIHENKVRPVIRGIDRNIMAIHPDNPAISIFDYLYTIEKAKEVHVMNSSFMNLIDCIQLRQGGLFYHEYSRPGINTRLRLPWKVFTVKL